MHNQNGAYMMDASKWPNLKEADPLEGESQLTQEEDLMGNAFTEELTVNVEEEDTQGWVEQSARKKKGRTGRQKTKPVIATRASSRVARDGLPIAAKAMARAVEKMIFRKVLPATLLLF